MDISLKHAVSNVILSRDTCTLCFKRVDSDAVDVEDIILLKVNNEHISVSFNKMIATLLGGDESNATLTSKLCGLCTISAVNCYNFISECQQARKTMSETLDKISTCLDDPSIEGDLMRSLYVAVDGDGDAQKYHDTYNTTDSLTTALKRFKALERKSWKKKLEEIEDYLSVDSEEYDSDNYNDLLIRIGDKVVTCNVCNSKFSSRKHLQNHYFKSHAPKVFNCDECPKAFAKPELLKKHYDFHHLVSSPCICDVCGRSFNNQRQLARHKRQLHSGGGKCPNCMKYFSRDSHLRRHIKSRYCLGGEEAVKKNFFCDTCGKGYRSKSYLMHHIIAVHRPNEKVKGHICQVCDRVWASPSALKHHMLLHTKEKNFSCETCGGKFGTNQSLIWHTRLHTGETPYQCKFCDKKFINTSRRAQHVRMHHDEEPTKECDLCGSKFRATNDLKRHRRRHLQPTSRIYVPGAE